VFDNSSGEFDEAKENHNHWEKLNTLVFFSNFFNKDGPTGIFLGVLFSFFNFLSLKFKLMMNDEVKFEDSMLTPLACALVFDVRGVCT
jgi:hypothetical protein